MKLRIVAATIAALAASSAFAFGTNGDANTVYLTGASASRPDLIVALNTLCTAAGGTFSNLASTDSNSRLYKCSADFNGVPGVKNVAHNVNGGSLTAVLKMGDASTSFVDPACTTAPCTNFVNAAGEGGYADLDLTVSDGYLATKGVTISTFAPVATGLGQTFGVAVSSNLYAALFTAQQASGLIPAAPTCTVTSTDAACTPTVSKAEVSSVLAGTTFVKGATGGTAIFNGVAANKLTYCRRPVTSGTQAGAQLYFLSNPVATTVSYGGAVPVVGGDVADPISPSKFTLTAQGARLETSTGSGTGDAIKCLNQATNTNSANAQAATGTTAFRIGILSAENNPGGSDTWKFVRLSEVPVTNAVTGAIAPNTLTAQRGRYDYFLETVSYDNGDATVAALLSAAAANMTGTTNSGIFKLGTGFKHAGGKPSAPVLK